MKTTLAIILLSVSIVSAQNTPYTIPDLSGFINSLASVGLSEVQQVAIAGFERDTQEQVAALNADPNLPSEQKQQSLSALAQNVRQEILPMLSPEQLSKLAKIHGAALVTILELSPELNLTAKQQNTIQTILAQTHTQIVAIRAANNGESYNSKAIQVTALKSEMNQQINSVLSPTQQETLSKLKANGDNAVRSEEDTETKENWSRNTDNIIDPQETKIFENGTSN